MHVRSWLSSESHLHSKSSVPPVFPTTQGDHHLNPMLKCFLSLNEQFLLEFLLRFWNCCSHFYKASVRTLYITSWTTINCEIKLFNVSWPFLLSNSHCCCEYVIPPIPLEVDFLGGTIVLRETKIRYFRWPSRGGVTSLNHGSWVCIMAQVRSLSHSGTHSLSWPNQPHALEKLQIATCRRPITAKDLLHKWAHCSKFLSPSWMSWQDLVGHRDPKRVETWKQSKKA